jgi:hypothetical protein
MSHRGLGISGAHRVGKSTLAKAAAEKMGIQFCETRCSEVFNQEFDGVRYKPSDGAIPFHHRILIQAAMLEHLSKRYAAMTGPFIADRTPVDVIAYLFCEVGGSTIPRALREEYTNRMNDIAVRAIGICENQLAGVVHLQPGIDLVEGADKAVACPVYIRHLNMLVAALVNGWVGSHFYAHTIPHGVLDLDRRVEHVGHFAASILNHQQAQITEQLAEATIH